MAVKPSSNNRFGGRSLVSDIAGVGKANTAKRAMSAADIIKKQQETVMNALETEENIKTENPDNTAKERNKTIETETPKNTNEIEKEMIESPNRTESKETIIESLEKTETEQIKDKSKIETPKESVLEPSITTQIPNTRTENNTTYAEINADTPNNQMSGYQNQYPGMYQQPAQYGYPQQNQYSNPAYGMNQQNYYGNYQNPYQNITPGMNSNVDVQTAELHKTTNYGIFDDYPDINVRLPMKTGGDREMLKKSILESGIADPIIVAPVNDVIRAFQAVQFPVPNYPANVQFIIIAGQNRRSIAKELNVELPFIIKRGLTKEQMDAIGLDTNLLNRQFSAMKPSEQVYIVNRRRALFEQNNTRNIRGKLSEITGYEKTYIYQLLSLVNVKRELLTDFVDPGYISVSGITHLVSVPFNNQELLYDYLIRYNIQKLMASQLKALLQDTTTEWTDQYLNQVLFPNTKKLSNITLRPDQYQSIIPEEDLPKANEIIIAALKDYYKNRK